MQRAEGPTTYYLLLTTYYLLLTERMQRAEGGRARRRGRPLDGDRGERARERLGHGRLAR